MNKYIPSLAIASLLTTTQSFAQDHPNIILFLVDDMGVMDTSVPFLTDADGQVQTHPLNNWYHTPNMERLAEQGIRFSTFYAQSVSSPSRTSIMTGQNAARHRTTNWINSESNNRTTYGPHDWNWKGITSDTPVYPKLLQEAGYRTIHVGKAHFGCIGSEGEDPRNVGFDVNIGGNSIGQPGSYYGEWGYGFIKGNKSRAVPGLEKYHGSDVFLTDALTLEANAEMEKAVKEGIPFYLNMSHYAVHQPFEADKRYLDKYKNSGKGSQAEAFATLVEGMDKSLGDLIQKLEELGVAENTLILFLGDNGGDAPLGGPADYGSSAPLRGKKGSEYEGGVRVPFIAAWAKPDNKNKFQKKHPIAQNAVQPQQGTVMDLYPTILSVAGVDAPKDYTLDGSDLKKLLQGKADKKHRDDFLMHFPHGEHRANYFTTYRKGDWKLIYYYNPDTTGEPSWKLYNLKEDPYEASDLAEKHPEKVASMIEQMKKRLNAENALYPVDKEQPQYIVDVQAHRGGMGLLPANTLEAMKNAVDLGVNTLEIDIVVTKDKKVIMSHDKYFTAEETTYPDGTPMKKEDPRVYMWKLTYEEIAKYDVGMRQHPGYPEQKTLPAIRPLLSDVLTFIENYTQEKGMAPMKYNIEIKADPDWNGGIEGVDWPVYNEMVDICLGVILPFDLGDRLIIQTFDERALAYMHEKYPDLHLSYLVGGGEVHWLENKEMDFDTILGNIGFVPEWFSPASVFVSKSCVDEAHRRGMKVVTWTVDNKDEMTRMIDAGVDAIISNYPDRLLEVVKEYNPTTPDA